MVRVCDMSCLPFSSLSYTLTNIYLIVSVAAANVEGYIRDTSLAEDAVGNVKWSLKTILTVDQIGKVQCRRVRRRRGRCRVHPRA